MKKKLTNFVTRKYFILFSDGDRLGIECYFTYVLTTETGMTPPLRFPRFLALIMTLNQLSNGDVRL